MQEKIKTENYINKDLEKSERIADLVMMKPSLTLIMKNNFAKK